mgnify:CR=1 FL=1
MVFIGLAKSYSQLSKIHYVPPIVQGSDPISDQEMYISTPSVGEIPVYIKPIGQPRSSWIIENVSNDKPFKYRISDTTNSQLIVNNSSIGLNPINNRGYIVESPNGVIYVNVRFNSGSTYQQGGFVSKGEAALGSTFRTAVMPNGNASQGFGTGFQNFISILATKDTRIKIENIPNGLSSIDNTGITFPFEIDLKENESFVISQSWSTTVPTNTERFALIGALINEIDSSGNKILDKSLVVNTGSITGKFGGGNGRDYGVDQITGLSTLGSGNEYVLVKGNGGGDGVENALIIAHEPNTEIWIDNSLFTTIRNAGESYYYEIPGNPGQNVYIKAIDASNNPKPIFVYQSTGFNNGTSAANQGMFFVPPLSCSAKGNIDLIPFIGEPERNGTALFDGQFSIVTNSGANLVLTDSNGNILADKNGLGSTNLNTYMYLTVPINGIQYETYYLNSTQFKGKNIKIESDKELYVAYISQNGPATSGSFFSGFVTEPFINADLTVEPYGVCIDINSGLSNVVLETPNASSFDLFKWKIKNVDTSTTPPTVTWSDAPSTASNPNDQYTYTPTQEGIYKLVGNLSCYPGVDYESAEQVVSICPTDDDNDGIIDNLDLDFDNDGILNSIESISKVDIDLSDSDNAKASLPNGIRTFDSKAISSTNSSFTGSNNGTFLSQVVPTGISEHSSFYMNPFGEKLNIKFSEDTSVSYSGDPSSEYFTLTVYPSDKNITLIDPGEKLLVDVGGGFSTIGGFGFSGNKITFKYNDDPVDPSLNYEFFGFDLEGIQFEHHVTSTASSDSNFNGLFEIINYQIDTDGDNIPDMFDPDSDNDGCPDVEEADNFFDNVSSGNPRPRVFRDPDKNYEYGDQSLIPPYQLGYSLGNLDERGRILDLVDPGTGTYTEPPIHPDPSINSYLFQHKTLSKETLSIISQPEDIQVCVNGSDVQFQISVSPGSGATPFYQWQIDEGSGWKNLLDSSTTPLTVDDTLDVLQVDDSMDGYKYRAIVWNNIESCYEISDEAVLKVEPTLPTAEIVDISNPLIDSNWIIKCDSGTNEYDGISTFDLTLLNSYILGTQNPSTFEVSYFLDPNNAILANTTGIANPNVFKNTPSATYDSTNPSVETIEIHVRVKNLVTECLADPTSFELTINPKPLLVNIPDVEQCNDIVFDLDDLRDDISANYTNETFEFFDSSGNLIPQADWSTYELPDLTVSNEELITVVVKNDPSLGSPCDQTTSFTLRAGVCEIPTSFPVTDEITCETDPSPLGNNQDGIETFANAPTFFSTLKSDLETANPLFLTAGTVITFYKSSADATAGAAANAINTTVAYTTDPNDPGNTFNTAEDRWEQEIWVRVENPTLTTPCVDTQLVGRFIINKLPELKVTSYAVKQCDDPLFNLTTLESDLAVSHGSLTFEWFDSNGNTIPNPIQYEIPNRALQETITVEISTNPTLGSSCVSSTIIDIDLQWLPTTPPPGFDPTKHDQYTIETDPDPTGQGQDGVETFSNAFFAAIQNDIETLDPRLAGKSFAFYRSQRDAQVKDDEINTSIDFTTNPDPAKQGQWWDFNTAENRWEYHIWVYVSDAVTTAINTCYLLEKVATVYVEKRPIVYPVVDQELCDDGTTSGEKLDKKSVFDTSAIFTELITDPLTGTAQNNSLFTVEYSYIDAAGNPATSSELPDSSNLFNSSSQTVTVTFTNNTTNTAGLPGSSTGTLDFIVYDTPVAYPTDPSTGIYEITECDDLASGADNDGATLFDITGLEDLLLTDPNGIDPAQVSANYDFIFTDSSGNPITLTSDYRAEDGDTIDVSITNPLFTSCSETITVVFTVNPLPTFTVDPDAIVCIGPTAQPIEIGVDSFLDDYDYSWVYNGTIYNNPAPTSPNNDRILVDNGGTYEVTATDKITGCERTLSINVTESAIATITEDDITVEDLTNDNNNTITIDTTNLGIGDYEFAIDDAFGPYQDDPLFEQVEPGIHTIYIRDKNGCGLAQIQVSVIGYKKFFTPNNDGYNDTWKVLGIRPGYQETSKVYIFDRYGKLIKELDPLREGWDGTYLGRPMPQTDYWFRVFLEDGREFKGHFSLIRGRK